VEVVKYDSFQGGWWFNAFIGPIWLGCGKNLEGDGVDLCGLR
jgi:hypothetical protein